MDKKTTWIKTTCIYTEMKLHRERKKYSSIDETNKRKKKGVVSDTKDAHTGGVQAWKIMRVHDHGNMTKTRVPIHMSRVCDGSAHKGSHDSTCSKCAHA
jgi:hypothetical protein